MIKMVVGFLFSGPRVLLVRKTRPSWQAGLLNGVGGKVEDNETPIAAMYREFGEETSHKAHIDWKLFCTEYEEPQKAMVYFYVGHVPDRPTMPIANDVGEELRWVRVEDLPFHKKLGNLTWLIPLALDPRQLFKVDVTVQGDVREMATW